MELKKDLFRADHGCALYNKELYVAGGWVGGMKR